MRAVRTPLVPAMFRPWVAVLNTFGLPTALVVFFLLQNAGWVPSEMRSVASALDMHNATVARNADADLAAKKALTEALVGLRQEFSESNRISRAICTVAGDKPDIRNACLGR